jgi:hypothetical protein
MTVAEAGEIFAYWERHPPPHLLLQGIAAALGCRPATETGPIEAALAGDVVASLAAAPPPGLAVTAGAPAQAPAPVFDRDELFRRNRARAAAIAARSAAG